MIIGPWDMALTVPEVSQTTRFRIFFGFALGSIPINFTTLDSGVLLLLSCRPFLLESPPVLLFGSFDTGSRSSGWLYLEIFPTGRARMRTTCLLTGSISFTKLWMMFRIGAVLWDCSRHPKRGHKCRSRSWNKSTTFSMKLTRIFEVGLKEMLRMVQRRWPCWLEKRVHGSDSVYD